MLVYRIDCGFIWHTVPIDSILFHMNPVHNLSSYFLRSIPILPSNPRLSFKWSCQFRLVCNITTLFQQLKTIQRQMKGWLVSDELERFWKDAVVAKFKVPSRYSPRGTEKNHENLRQDSWSPDRDVNPGRPEYEGVLTTRPRYSV
jgi:hypothetical protein